jgi:hypothetical protein
MPISISFFPSGFFDTISHLLVLAFLATQYSVAAKAGRLQRDSVATVMTMRRNIFRSSSDCWELTKRFTSLRCACSSWRSGNDESPSDGRLCCETSNAWCGWCRCSLWRQRKQSGQLVQVQKQARRQVSTACAWLTPCIERQHWRSSTRVSSHEQHFPFLAAGLQLRKAPAGRCGPRKRRSG